MPPDKPDVETPPLPEHPQLLIEYHVETGPWADERPSDDLLDALSIPLASWAWQLHGKVDSLVKSLCRPN